MTLIAGFTVNNAPILIGDILISGKEYQQPPVKIPTVGDVSEVFPGGSGFTVVGTRQKICIISDNLAIGWAGSYVAAKVIIQDLIRKSKATSFTCEYIESYFEGIDEDIANLGVELIITIIDSNRTRGAIYRYDSMAQNSLQLGQFFLGGSGADDMREAIEGFVKAAPKATSSGLDQNTIPLTMAALLTSRLLTHDLASKKSLLQYYGGGYEIAYFEKTEFKKLDDISYLFWTVHCEDSKRIGVSSFPLRILTFRYTNDLLSIRAFSIKGSKDHKPIGTADEMFFIPPIHRAVAKKDVINSLNYDPISQSTVHVFQIINHQGEVIGYNQHFEHSKDPSVKLEPVDGKSRFRLLIKKDFLARILEFISKDYI